MALHMSTPPETTKELASTSTLRKFVQALLKLPHSFLAMIPRTKAFEAHREERLDHFRLLGAKRLKDFYDEKEYDPRSLNVDVWSKLALSEFWTTKIDAWFFAVFLILSLSGALLAPFIAARLSHIPASSLHWAYTELFGLVASLACAFVLLLPFILVNDLEEFYFDWPILSIGIGAAILLLGAWLSYRLIPRGGVPSSYLRLVMVSALITLGITLLSILSAGISSALIGARLEKRSNRVYPLAAIVDGLSNVVVAIRYEGSHWNSLGNRHYIAKNLENAARCIELFLPGRLATGDAVMDAWLKSECEARAAGLRELEKDILFARVEEHDDYRKSMQDVLLHAIRCEWDALPYSTPDKPTPREKWSSRLVSVARALVIAAFPLLLLLWIKRPSFPVVITGQPLIWTKLGLFVWLVVALIPIVDPGYEATSKAFSLIGQMPFFGKGGSTNNEK